MTPTVRRSPPAWDALRVHPSAAARTIDPGKVFRPHAAARAGRGGRKEPNATTLYLPGLELKLDHASKVVRGTRFYTFGGQTVAVRDTSGMKFLASDHQGTQSAVVDAATGAITRRRTSRPAKQATWQSSGLKLLTELSM
jgi:hypothetical protein